MRIQFNRRYQRAFAQILLTRRTQILRHTMEEIIAKNISIGNSTNNDDNERAQLTIGAFIEMNRGLLLR